MASEGDRDEFEIVEGDDPFATDKSEGSSEGRDITPPGGGDEKPSDVKESSPFDVVDIKAEEELDSRFASTPKSAGEEGDWLLELETALEVGCEFSTLRSIAQNRPLSDVVRGQAWQILLGVANKGDPFVGWEALYDLPEQGLIRKDCEAVVATLGNSGQESIGVQSDLESIVTLFCKTREQSYQSGNGWSEVLRLLVSLKFTRQQLYNTFQALITKYVVRSGGNFRNDGRAYDLFRLLLLYHEPKLCSFLDTKHVYPDAFGQSWFSTLFAGPCDLDVTLKMWDVYLQQADPFLVFFMALVILVNVKDTVIEMSDATAEEISDMIAKFPSNLSSEDIQDFCQLATYYSSKTPQSFRRDYHGPVFGSNLAEAFENVQVHSLLCLPISVQELLQAHLRLGEDIEYLVVDCRPAEQYANGHLPGAFNLDATLMVNRPEEYALAMQTLCVFKEKTHPTDHLCFMGSGRDREDKYVHMLVANFLQKYTQHVSLARGGYAALHEVLKESLSTRLKSHSVRFCLSCNPPAAEEDGGFLDSLQDKVPVLLEKVNKVGSGVKSRAAVLRGKMAEYMAAPAGNKEEEPIKHVKSKDRSKGKAYRNSEFMFSIDDDDNAQSGSSEDEERRESTGSPMREKVKIQAWVKRPEMIAHFPCHEVSDKAEAFPAHLLVTRTHLHIIRESESDPDWGHMRAKRPLFSIVKITSKKHYPELLTFKYGQEITPGQPSITNYDRLLIEKAGDAAKMIKSAIIDLQAASGTGPKVGGLSGQGAPGNSGQKDDSTKTKKQAADVTKKSKKEAERLQSISSAENGIFGGDLDD